MTGIRPIDFKRAALREAAHALFADVFGYRASWRLAPATPGAGLNDPQWLGDITFNKKLQPHHAHAIAIQGCIAELQFIPETPHLPKDQLAVYTTLMNGYEFSSFELDLIKPYQELSKLKDIHEAGSTLWAYCLSGHGAWERVVKEARAGRYRDPEDNFRFSW